MTMKMPVNVIKFSETYSLKPLFEAFSDFYSHVKYNEGDKTRTFWSVDADGKQISFSQKEENLNKLFVEAVAKISGMDSNILGANHYATNPNVVHTFFAVVDAIVDYVLPVSVIDSIGMYTDVRVGGYGDSFKFDVKPRDLFPVTKASRGKRIAELQKQFNRTVSLVPENHMITVYASLYRILAGQESIGDFAMKAVRSIEVEMTRDVYTAFNTAMTSLPTVTDGELKFTGYSQESLIRLLQRVSSWNQGSQAVILGTQLALQNILPNDANYRYDLVNSEFVKLGYVRNVFGADVIMLPQVADWRTNFKMLLDDTRIYVVSPGQQKIVKLCLEGSTTSYTSGTYDNANLTQTTTMNKSWVAGVVTNSVAGLIVLS